MAGIAVAAERLKNRAGRVFYGWWIVTGSFFIQLLVGSLMIHSFTAYFPFLQAQFGWSRTMLSGAFSLSRAESGLLGPVEGWLIQTFGPRAMVRLGIVLFGGGFILFSLVNSVWSYYLTVTVMALGTSLAGFLTVSATLVNWFEKKRSVAIGLAMSGFGIGGLLVPAVAWSLTAYGWRPTAFFSGVLIVLLGFPIGQLMRQRPEKYGYLPDGASPESLSRGGDSTPQPTIHHAQPASAGTGDFTTKEAMRTSAFWLLSLGHSMALLTVGAVSLHLIPHIIDSVGLSVTAASSAVAVMTVFNILGQLGGGFLGDRFSKRVLATVAMLMHSVALLTLAYATTLLPVFIFAVLHGTAWGVRGPMMTTIRADYFGRASFATIMGFSSLLVMVGMTTGPLLAGFMADIFDGYRIGFIVIAAMTGMGSVFFAFARKPRPPIRLPGLAYTPAAPQG